MNMEQTQSQWREVCFVEDIPVRGAVKVKHDQQTIAIFRTASGQVRALEDRCPHKGGPLSDGIVHGDCVTCPLHNWDISLETGCAIGVNTANSDTSGANDNQVRTYTVRIIENRVFLKTLNEVVLSVV